ncbi:hypothetical protein Pcinc_034583 [Petrolisthes cinctipes]|uniref:Uncharacterized protein n=1 Tax=Petrolisthes cinctipes TaxID=88211 RepID=A0AAE1BYG2_PETCI|nr:hypothetical protein Pcinc_034583 [Petrolisthes cinctipes]
MGRQAVVLKEERGGGWKGTRVFVYVEDVHRVDLSVLYLAELHWERFLAHILLGTCEGRGGPGYNFVASQVGRIRVMMWAVHEREGRMNENVYKEELTGYIGIQRRGTPSIWKADEDDTGHDLELT